MREARLHEKELAREAHPKNSLHLIGCSANFRAPAVWATKHCTCLSEGRDLRWENK